MRKYLHTGTSGPAYHECYSNYGRGIRFSLAILRQNVLHIHIFPESK